MLKLLPFLFIALAAASCLENAQNEESAPAVHSESVTESQKTTALKFINGYVENANLMGKAIETREWANQNPLASEHFKRTLNQLIGDAEKADPELGLDFDPILDAQDYPDEGFKVEEADEETGYVTVAGKKWTDFKVKMKLVRAGQQWLVDGCGVINIPEEEQIKR